MGWRLLLDCSKTGVAVYWSNYKFSIGRGSDGEDTPNLQHPSDRSNKSFQCFKIVGTIKHSYHVVCSVFSDPKVRHPIDHKMATTTLVDYLHPIPGDGSNDGPAYASAVIKQQLRLGKLVTLREFLSHISLRHMPDTDEYIFAFKTTKHRMANEGHDSSKATRHLLYGGHILTKVDDNTTRYTILMLTKMSDMTLIGLSGVGEKLLKTFAKRPIRKMHHDLVEQCDDAVKKIGDVDRPVGIVQDSPDYVRMTLEDNDRLLDMTTTDS